ncbi:MAG: hypothetical protein EOO39_23960, partial [Cytophagaceae bacterium]
MISLSVTNLPTFASFTDNGNGTGTINVIPNLGSVGYYPNIVVTAKDSQDSSRSTSFDITVLDKDVTSTYISFSDGNWLGQRPWNNIAGWPVAGNGYTNLVDEANVTTPVSITMVNGFEGPYTLGMHPNNGKSIYPEEVQRTAYYESTTTARTLKITGLTTTRRYNFVFFNSVDMGINGTTEFVIGSTVVSLNASYNHQKTVQINGVQPNASGEVTITVRKATGASFAYINTIAVESYANGLDMLSPTKFVSTGVTSNSVSLSWSDRAYGETNYQIWRSTSPATPFTLLATLPSNTTSYTNTGLTTNTTYYYKVRAIKSGTNSGYSATVTETTDYYKVYVNMNSNPADVSGTPWNNTNATPAVGTTWNNFNLDNATPSNVGMAITQSFSEVQPLGMNTTNNSGALPDNVLKKTFFVFPGVRGEFKLTGLNLTLRYNLSIYGSVISQGDATTAYTVNGVRYTHNASLNIGNGNITMYGLQPDANGQIIVSVERESTGSPGGYMAALILSARKQAAPGLPAEPTRAEEPLEQAPVDGRTTQQVQDTSS